MRIYSVEEPMIDRQEARSDAQPTLRLWPAVVILALQFFTRFLLPVLAPETLQVAVIGGLLGGPLLAIWWLFFSRAPKRERLIALAVVPIALWAGFSLSDASIATGMQGMMFFIYTMPLISAAFVLWAVLSRRFAGAARLTTMIVAICLGSIGMTFVRSGGFSSALDSDMTWRWAATAEDKLVSATRNEPKMALTAEELSASPITWPGFRGQGRDGVVHGSHIGTDWASAPPRTLWRRPIGPGWSSFAVRGKFLFTQEQRGEEELVSCYRLDSGQPVWHHGDMARFWEANAGAGPRGTPTLDGDEVYTLGATGLLNALRVADGSVIWRRDIAAETGAETPIWGFSASPLVLGDLVLAAAAGDLIACDRLTGAVRWKSARAGTGYSSPQMLTLAGVPQILQQSAEGVASFDPTSGQQLWHYDWEGYPIVQPQAFEGDLLLSVSQGSGLRRLSCKREGENWTLQERWTSKAFKPYFNDFAIKDGHAYGFDGSVLACIDLASGERRWKGGRYGNGQMLLLADQALMLVLGEKGQLALVEAKPTGFKEVARAEALAGITWNHPVLVDGLLIVRNGKEMSAIQL